jgi:FkbM family methyltransferase
LARFITCELRLAGQPRLALRSKYEVASFGDVFCHPFYWQVFGDTREIPSVVVDLGAHCGHFTLLVDACVRARQPRGITSYILVEPNPYLLPVIRRNLLDVGLSAQARVLPGLVGVAHESATLYINPKSYLMAGLDPVPGSRPHVVPRVDLAAAIGSANIDIMKMDIEGAEYALVRDQAPLFRRVRTLFMELHSRDTSEQEALQRTLKEAGLDLVQPPLPSAGHYLLLWRRR